MIGTRNLVAEQHGPVGPTGKGRIGGRGQEANERCGAREGEKRIKGRGSSNRGRRGRTRGARGANKTDLIKRVGLS